MLTRPGIFCRSFFNTVFSAAALFIFSSCATAQAAASGEWKTAPAPLATRWAKDINPQSPLPEYPRPQMTRPLWTNLNGLWDYAITDRTVFSPPKSFEGNILVPFPLESALSGVAKRIDENHALWYRRSFEIPDAWKNKRALLHFGAVDWKAAVFVNGVEIGTHRGGYSPFSFDITDAINRDAKEQTLAVRVWDPTDKGPQPRGKQSLKPEGIWYTPTTGIWQTVWIEPVPETHIESVVITPDIDKSTLSVTIAAAAAGPDVDAVASLVFKDIKTGAARKIEAAGKPGRGFTLAFPEGAQPQLWSPENPALYTVRASLSSRGKTIDTVETYAGMRKVEVRKDARGTPRIFLNNKPYFMYGPLDQGFWPDGLYTAPTDEALRFDIEMTKKFGFNMTRKHVKTEPARWYYYCDKLGLLVWQDMPSGDEPARGVSEIIRSEESDYIYRSELKELIGSLRVFPSIVMWVPFNEGWGQYDTVNIAEWTKKYDPSRLVNNASGWTDMACGDTLDMHHYPEPASPENNSGRAAVLGEFGGLGLVLPGHNWKEGMARMSGQADDNRNWGYRDFSDRDTLWKQYSGYISYLPFLSRWEGLSAAVYTQLTDVETEVNGLMTYDREIIKASAAQVAALHEEMLSKINDNPAKATGPGLRLILPPSGQSGGYWRYALKLPGEDWAAPGFDDSGWKKGKGGFGAIGTPGAKTGTVWNSENIWLRRNFDAAADCEEYYIYARHSNDAEIYINGIPAASAPGSISSYAYIPVSKEAAASIRPGANTVAATMSRKNAPQYIDAGIAAVCK